MFAAKLFPLDQAVRINPKPDHEELGILEIALLEAIRLRQGTIWRRGKDKFHKYWETFATDQGTDPFGHQSRVEMNLTNSLTGKWNMTIYWSQEGPAWAGMHISIDYRWEWPIRCQAVF